jgi:hypothetical protein
MAAKTSLAGAVCGACVFADPVAKRLAGIFAIVWEFQTCSTPPRRDG